MDRIALLDYITVSPAETIQTIARLESQQRGEPAPFDDACIQLPLVTVQIRLDHVPTGIREPRMKILGGRLHQNARLPPTVHGSV